MAISAAAGSFGERIRKAQRTFWFVALALGLCFLELEAEAFEPTELLQWNQGLHLRSDPTREAPRLRVEPSWRYFPWNETPAQIGRSNDAPSKHQLDLRVQYPLLESPEWGKMEVYFGPAYLTVEDVPDRLNLTMEVGYTIWDKLRFELGQFRGLNVGRSNPSDASRGATQVWIGGSYKLLHWENLLLDAYGRYYLEADTEAMVSNQVEDADPIRGEVGARAYYRFLRFFNATLAPYMLFDSAVARVGAYPELRYNFGEHVTGERVNALTGLSVELGGNLNIDVNAKNQTQNAVWIRVIWELR